MAPRPFWGNSKVRARQGQGVDRRTFRQHASRDAGDTGDVPFVAQEAQVEMHTVADHDGTIQQVSNIRQQDGEDRRLGDHGVGNAVHADHLRRYRLLRMHQRLEARYFPSPLAAQQGNLADPGTPVRRQPGGLDIHTYQRQRLERRLQRQYSIPILSGRQRHLNASLGVELRAV